MAFASTIKHADRIVVLENGRIIEIGSHELISWLRSVDTARCYAANAAGGCVMITTRAIAI